MSGKLSFQLEMTGLDATLNKLKELNRLLDNISRKGAGVFGRGGGNTFTGGGGSGSPLIAKTAEGALIGAGVGNYTTNNFRMMLPFAKTNGLSIGQNARLQLNKLNFGSSGGTPPKMGDGKDDPFLQQLFRLSAATGALTTLFTQLSSAVKAGAEAFTNAARVGHGVAATSQLQMAMQMIGISGEATQHMLLEAERNRTQRQFGVPGTNMMVAAARVSGFGNVQQLENMSKQFEDAMKKSETSARQMELSSGRNLQTSMKWNEVVMQFKTFAAQYAADLAPLLQGLLQIINLILQGANKIAELGLWIQQRFHLDSFLGGGLTPGQSRIGSLNNTLPHSNAWVGIGFVMQGGGPQKHLSEIALNTKETNSILKDIKKSAFLKGVTLGAQIALPMLP